MRLLTITIISLLLMAAPAHADDQAMIDLAWDTGCFDCHEVHRGLRGPAWIDVAERYRGDEGAFERLVIAARDGSRGNWGDEAMTANRRAPEEDIRTLVRWLLTLGETDK